MAFSASPVKFSTKLKKLALITSYSNSSTSSYDIIVSDRLKSQRQEGAPKVYNKVQVCDVYQCTKTIMDHFRNSRLDDALKLFYKMPVRDAVCWNTVIKGCLDSGDLLTARKVFDEMPERSVVSWTTIFNGYLQVGRVEEAEKMFSQMPSRDVAAWNAMIHGYFSNGRIEDAMKLFEEMPIRNVISWTSMIGGLDQHGKGDEALYIFRKMLDSGVLPTTSTFACVLTACANLLAFNLGIQIHGGIIKFGHYSDVYLSASLITFYSNCRQIENARKIFQEKLQINVVVWTALLTGYSSNFKHEEGLETFRGMIRMAIFPNESSFTSALTSCAQLESLDWGKVVHTVAIKLGFETDSFVGNSLIVMYTTCGVMDKVVAIFKEIAKKNIVSWNSVIVGCAQNGHGVWALIFFDQMIRGNVEPDEITFTGLLSACNHAGLFQKGRRIFEYFGRHKSIKVKPEHYTCMVDILGRCGKLEEAEELIRTMPIKVESGVWLSLLCACRKHSSIEVAERAAKFIFDLEPFCSAAYILLSNLYASAERWNDVSRIRVAMKQRGVIKQPGCSWVSLKGSKHTFLSGDRTHPLSQKIYEKLDFLAVKMKELGYVPDQRLAFHDVEDEQKQEILSYHSERLAIGFGLLSTVEGSTIIVMKNLRICGDCHSAIKLMAKIVCREIIVRDPKRFHHFVNGTCSCGDYW